MAQLQRQLSMVEIKTTSPPRDADLSKGRPHTVLVIDRVLTAESVAEMGQKVRLPVRAFAWVRAADDGEGAVEFNGLSSDDAERIAWTLNLMRDAIRTPSVPAAARRRVGAYLQELRKALRAARQLAAGLTQESDAAAIADVRMAADDVHTLAEDLALLLFSWELDKDERERESEAE